MKRLLVLLLLLSGLALGQGQQQRTSVIVATYPVTSNYTSTVKPLPFVTYLGGTIIVRPTGVSGTGTSCVRKFYFGGISTNTFDLLSGGGSFTSLPSTVIGAPGTNPVSQYISPNSGNTAQNTQALPYAGIGMTFTCSAYASAGFESVEFIPDVSTNVFDYNHITTNTNTLLRSSPTILHTITINTIGSGETITVYDNSVCSTTVIAVITPAAGATFTFDVSTTNGLCITTAGTTPGDYTVAFR